MLLKPSTCCLNDSLFRRHVWQSLYIMRAVISCEYISHRIAARSALIGKLKPLAQCFLVPNGKLLPFIEKNALIKLCTTPPLVRLQHRAFVLPT